MTHSDTTASPASRRITVVLVSLVGILAAAAITGLILLWPSQHPNSTPADQDSATSQNSSAAAHADRSGEPLRTATVTAVDASGCKDGATDGCAQARATVEGHDVTLYLPSEAIADLPHVGSKVKAAPGEDAGSYVFVDYDRTVPLVLLAVLCALAVAGVAYFKGVRALLGLVFAFAVIIVFMLPAMLSGRPALPVGLTAAATIMLVVMYLAHGFSLRTTVALLGTAAGVALIGALAVVVARAASLNGRFEDDTYILTAYDHLSARDIVVCSILIAGIGVLNDVTITQVSALWELANANPRADRWELFTSAMRVGRDHIASSVYTVAFVLTGGALASLLVVSSSGRPVLTQLTLGQQSVETANILICLIGLALAVPITTAIAALATPTQRADHSPVRRGAH